MLIGSRRGSMECLKIVMVKCPLDLERFFVRSEVEPKKGQYRIVKVVVISTLHTYIVFEVLSSNS